MVNNAFSFTGNGLRDWVVQRVTAIILAAYTVFMVGYFVLHPHLSFSDWKSLFSLRLMGLFTLFALGSLALHSWVGIWTILTDYVKPVGLRFVLELLVILALISYFIWGIELVWFV